MAKLFWVSFAVLFLLPLHSVLWAKGGEFLKVPYHKSYQVGDKLYPVELVYTQNDGWIKLRIIFDNDSWAKGSGYSNAVKFLRAEVLILWLSENTEIGDGYTFTSVGKYPEWDPHRSDENGHMMYLRFTREGNVVGKQITGTGFDQLIGGLDPYDL